MIVENKNNEVNNGSSGKIIKNCQVLKTFILERAEI